MHADHRPLQHHPQLVQLDARSVPTSQSRSIKKPSYTTQSAYRSTRPRNLSAQLHKFVYSMRVFDLNAAAPQRLFLVTKQWKIKTGADSLAVHSQRKMIESNHFGATIGMLIRVDLIRPGRRSQVRLSDGHNEFIAYRSSSSSVQVHWRLIIEIEEASLVWPEKLVKFVRFFVRCIHM